MGLTLDQFGIDRLGPQQRLELISILWDRLADDVSMSVPDSLRGELERRVGAADGNPDAAEPWEEVRDRLEIKPRRCRSSCAGNEPAPRGGGEGSVLDPMKVRDLIRLIEADGWTQTVGRRRE